MLKTHFEQIPIEAVRKILDGLSAKKAFDPNVRVKAHIRKPRVTAGSVRITKP
jgi:hypothetical protein